MREKIMKRTKMPSHDLPTRVVRLTHATFSAKDLAARLRTARPPVVVRTHEGRVLIDPPTLLPGEAEEVVNALQSIAVE